MKKVIPHISAFLLTLTIVFVVSGLFAPQAAHAKLCKVYPPDHIPVPGEPLPCPPGTNPDSKSGGENWYSALTNTLNPLTWITKAFGGIVYLILQFVGLLTALSGVVLNGVIYYTVGQMSVNYTGLTAINSAWSTIRDIANMGFIFILLYAAIQTILGIGSDVKKLIVNVIVVAILINFSLFFTRIVIDISNILAIAFYDAIAPGALSVGSLGAALTQSGMSNAFMNAMNLQSLFNVTELGEIPEIITIGLMGSIMLLVATFVFFAAAIMFLIRYVILILVLILSPIAFMAFVLPALKKHGDQWKDALLGQAFFAPIYFMLIWVSLQVVTGIGTSLRGGGPIDATNALTGLATNGANNAAAGLSGGAFAMFINFIVVIVFLIAALIIAKEWANKAGGAVGGLNKWAMGAAGGATLGMAARGGRNIIGSRAAAMSDDEDLKKRAAEGSVRARLQLAAANKVSKSSFDVRGTSLGGSLDAGKAKTGGFAQDQKDRAKAYERYKPSTETVKDAKTNETRAREKLEEARSGAKREADTAVAKSPELVEAEKQLKKAQEIAARASSDPTKEVAVRAAQERVDTERKGYEQARSKFIETKTTVERLGHEQANQKKIEIETRMERMAQRMEKQRKILTFPLPSGVFVSGKVKANAIRTAAKGKSGKDKLADAYKDYQKEESGEETPTETPPTPPTPPPPPTSTT